MPNKASAAKEIRKGKKRELRNLRVQRNIKDLTKKAMRAIEAKAEDAVPKVKMTFKALDKAAQKGIMKKNTVSRRKARLARLLNAMFS